MEALRQVPLEKEAYARHFEPAKWGLREIPRVEILHGFVFGCMDPDAPELREYLGDGAWYFDALADVPGGIELLGPPSRSIMRTNWKYPAEGFAGDVYHVGVTHASIMKAVSGRARDPEDACRRRSGNPGDHAPRSWFFGSVRSPAYFAEAVWHRNWKSCCPTARRDEVDPAKGEAYAKAYAGHWNATLFPNCSFLLGLNIFKVWNPIGPDKIEVIILGHW